MLLPSHPASRIADPLSLVDGDSDSDDGLVPFWRFLSAVLEPLLSRDGEDVAVILKFRDILENISYSRGLGGSPDLSVLFSFAAGFRDQGDSHLADHSTGEGLELVRTRQEEKVQTLPTQSLSTHQEGRHRPTNTFEV